MDKEIEDFLLKYQEMRKAKNEFGKLFNKALLTKYVKLETELDTEAAQLLVKLKGK